MILMNSKNNFKLNFRSLNSKDYVLDDETKKAYPNATTTHFPMTFTPALTTLVLFEVSSLTKQNIPLAGILIPAALGLVGFFADTYFGNKIKSNNQGNKKNEDKKQLMYDVFVSSSMVPATFYIMDKIKGPSPKELQLINEKKLKAPKSWVSYKTLGLSVVLGAIAGILINKNSEKITNWIFDNK